MKTDQKIILLIEDEEVTALLQKEQLQNIGYSVVHISTGEMAVDFILNSKTDIDLILMDIDLGDGIDGTITAEMILQHKDIPIVFLSSHTEKEIVEKTEKITSYGYVVKNSGIIVLDASIKMAFKLFKAKEEADNHQKSLEISERKYRTIVNDAPWGIVIHKNGLIKYINPVGLSIGGWNDNEGMIGKPIMDFIHPDDREIVIERLKIQTNNKLTLPMITERLINRHGESVWCEVISVIDYEQNSPTVYAFFQKRSKYKKKK